MNVQGHIFSSYLTMAMIYTGGAVTDLDGDGKLEVILSHGESAEQPISVYRVNSDEVS